MPLNVMEYCFNQVPFKVLYGYVISIPSLKSPKVMAKLKHFTIKVMAKLKHFTIVAERCVILNLLSFSVS